MLLPTTLLFHAPGNGSPDLAPHHDWLIADPRTLHDPAARLWTARVTPHWRDWSALGRLTLTPLPPHRRRYLGYAGPLSDNRGHVRPAAHGRVQPHRWTDRRVWLTLHPIRPHPASAPIDVQLEKTGDLWLGRCKPSVD